MRSFINEESEIEYIIESFTKKQILNALNALVADHNDQVMDESESLEELEYHQLTEDIVTKFLIFKSNVHSDIMSDHDWSDYGNEHLAFLKRVHPRLKLENT